MSYYRQIITNNNVIEILDEFSLNVEPETIFADVQLINKPECVLYKKENHYQLYWTTPLPYVVPNSLLLKFKVSRSDSGYDINGRIRVKPFYLFVYVTALSLTFIKMVYEMITRHTLSVIFNYYFGFVFVVSYLLINRFLFIRKINNFFEALIRKR